MGLSHRIKKSSLEAGDHIYSWRVAYSYSHHGIFIGDDTVIHFMTHGVVSSSLDTFCHSSGKLRRYKYGSKSVSFVAKRGGTCTTAVSDDGGTVVHRAKYLLENGFGCYNLFKKNCENFAIYCKTGLLMMDRKKGQIAGMSGQVASFKSKATTVAAVGVPAALIVGAALAGPPLTAPFIIPPVVAVAGAEGVIIYCAKKYGKDIGVRRDVRKVAVEDLVEEAKKSYCDSEDHSSYCRCQQILEITGFKDECECDVDDASDDHDACCDH